MGGADSKALLGVLIFIFFLIHRFHFKEVLYSHKTWVKWIVTKILYIPLPLIQLPPLPIPHTQSGTLPTINGLRLTHHHYLKPIYSIKFHSWYYISYRFEQLNNKISLTLQYHLCSNCSIFLSLKILKSPWCSVHPSFLHIHFTKDNLHRIYNF